MREFVLFETLIRFTINIFMIFGELGASKMCFGFLHEVKVPKELQKFQEYE